MRPPGFGSDSVAPELHLERKRVRRIGKVVAEHAVERRQSGLAFWRRGFFRQAARDFPKRQIQPMPNQMHHAPDAAIDEARDASSHARRHQAEAGRIQNGPMRMLDQIRQSNSGVAHEPDRALHVSSRHAADLRHGVLLRVFEIALMELGSGGAIAMLCDNWSQASSAVGSFDLESDWSFRTDFLH